MPHLNHSGPERKGPRTGRGLGKCSKTQTEEELLETLGKGQGKKRQSGGGKGKGKRLRAGDHKTTITPIKEKTKDENCSADRPGKQD
ncbi:MAG TPA: DUF5320 domain-containing protein [Bacteroidales bacterium]|nr:DUF5320 domain-containing protein [Bacteroidales bacterium]HSA44027.1 DUF5320 domain-containing protein [Bacteroidales bacterium]